MVNKWPIVTRKMKRRRVRDIYIWSKSHKVLKVLKVLGILWDVNTISIGISNLIEILKGKINTKWLVLQISGSIYYPTSIINPFDIRLECLFEYLWTRKLLSRDTDFSIDICEKWTQWYSERLQKNQIKVPRFFSSSSNTNIVEIHC